MLKKLYLPLSLLVLLSMLLAACAPAVATEAPVVATEAPVVTEAPTEAPVVTEAPAAIDFGALFQTLIDGIPADKGYGTVTATALNEELVDKAPFMLDVREAGELEADGFIQGAVHIPVREVLNNLDKLPGLDEPIVIYCASGHRGGFVMSALKLLGYTNVRNLAGGIGAWKKAELAVVTGSMPEAAKAISQPIVADKPLYDALNGFFTGLPEGFYTIKAADLNGLLGGADAPTLVDIRTEKEFAENGYIDGAINLPLATILQNLDKLPAQDKPIVIYCVSGHRGSIVTMALRMLGYTDVRNLGGGINAWKAAQLPLAGVVDWMAEWTTFTTGLPQGFYSISAADLNTLITEKAPFLLDVREAGELEKDGFIAGAVHIPTRDVLKNLDKLPALDQPIVIYCASGHRGSMVMAALRLLGYTDVRNLGGGIGAWKKAELPLVTEPVTEPVAGTAPEVDAARFAALDAFLSGLPEGFFTVSAADLNAELAGTPAPVVVDVRSAEEIAKTGVIAGALAIPVNELFTKLDQLPADKTAPIVITCASGHRGGFAMMALRMVGYSNVRNLAGGMNAWLAAELPVTQ